MKSKNLLPQFRILATAVIAVGACVNANAATYNWQTGGTTNNWSTGAGDTNWFIDAGSTLSTWANGNAAVFSGAGEVVTVSGTPTPTSVTVGAGDGNWTLNGAIGGTGTTLTKNGTGTLTLSGTNTYTGGTNINGGKISINATNTLSTTGTVNIGANGILEMTGSAGTVRTYAQTISGSGAINLTGSGLPTLEIAKLSGFTGTININLTDSNTAYRKLAFQAAGSGGSMPSASSTINVSNGNALYLDSRSYAGTVNVQGTGNGEGLGALRLDNNATLSGSVHLLGNTSIGSAGGASTISGNIDGAFGVTKLNGTTLTLSGANAYTGNTVVSAGTLALGNNLALQNSALDTTAGGVVNVTGSTTPTLGGLTGSGNLASKITTGYSGVTSLTLNPTTGSQTYSGSITNGAANMTLTKTGAGTQVLSGNNSHTGGTTVNGGTLSVGHVNALGATSGAVTVTTGTLALGNFNIAQATIALNGGTLTNTTAYAGTVNIGGAVAITGTYGTVNAGSDALRSINTTGNLSVGTLSGQGTFSGGNVNVSTALAPVGTVDVNGDLSLGGTTTLDLGVTPDFVDVSGTLTVGGTLAILGSGVLNTTYNLFDFGSLSGNFSGVSLNDGIVHTFTANGNLWNATIGGLDYSFSRTTGNLTVVPEPAAALLGGLGLLALLRRRRN